MSFSIKDQLIVVFIYYFVSQISGKFINDKNCGLKKPVYISNYIVGGTDAQTNEYPFMASLQYNGSHFCGATILNSRWLLTAAHCIEPQKLTGIFKGPSDIQIIIGSVDNSNLTKADSYTVSKWIINGCFMRPLSDDVFDSDITLLMTTEDILFNHNNIGTICLPPKEAEPTSSQIEVAGWGVTTETNSLYKSDKASRLLQKTTGQLLPEKYCIYYTYFRNIGLLNFKPSKRICFRSLNSTVCRGDSGGPAFQTVNGRVHQFGVASFLSTTLPINTCLKGNPAFYLKVSHYVDWISDSIEKYEKSNLSDIKTDCDQ